MPESAINCDHLGKRYLIRHEQRERYTALRDVLTNKAKGLGRRIIDLGRSPVGRPASEEEFWALKDVSFEVQPGERIGIIGRNGAGKSTLLKLLSRITEPSAGRIELHGRVGSLLEVGTGFHPELTGRENIYLNGAILGMSKDEITKRFDEIVAFAEVEKFLDTPVKRYSSGMYVRLAFAVAAHMRTEILVVDEVLAVGDVEFQRKCLGKMDRVAQEGRTVVLVSHNMAVIRALSQRVIMAKAGVISVFDDPEEALALYSGRDKEGETLSVEHFQTNEDAISVTTCEINGVIGDSVSIGPGEHELLIRIGGTAHRPAPIDVEAKITDETGTILAYFSPGHVRGSAHRVKEGPFLLEAKIYLPRLNAGQCGLTLKVTDPGVTVWAQADPAARILAEGDALASGVVLPMRIGGWELLLGDSTLLDTPGRGDIVGVAKSREQ